MAKSVLLALSVWFLLFLLPSFTFNFVGWDLKNLFLAIFTLNLLAIAFFYFCQSNSFTKYCSEFRVSAKIIFVALALGIALKLALNPIFNFDLILGYIKIGDLTIHAEPFPTTRALIAIFLVSTSEEILYRQILLKKFINLSNNKFFSVLLSSLLFASIHLQSLNLVFYTFCLGVILSIVFLDSRNIVVPIIVHIIINFVAIVLESSNAIIYFDLLDDLNFGLGYWSIVCLGTVVTLFLIRHLRD